MQMTDAVILVLRFRVIEDDNELDYNYTVITIVPLILFDVNRAFICRKTIQIGRPEH